MSAYISLYIICRYIDRHKTPFQTGEVLSNVELLSEKKKCGITGGGELFAKDLPPFLGGCSDQYIPDVALAMHLVSVEALHIFHEKVLFFSTKKQNYKGKT